MYIKFKDLEKLNKTVTFVLSEDGSGKKYAMEKHSKRGVNERKIEERKNKLLSSK